MDKPIMIKGTCPNGDGVELMPLIENTLARIIELLDTRTFMLRCLICGAEFPPTEEEILKLRKQLGD
jgi:hypothetical protein